MNIAGQHLFADSRFPQDQDGFRGAGRNLSITKNFLQRSNDRIHHRSSNRTSWTELFYCPPTSPASSLLKPPPKGK